MKYILTPVILLFLVVLPLSGEIESNPKTLISLESILQSSIADSTRLQILTDLAVSSLDTAPDLAILVCQEGEHLARNISSLSEVLYFKQLLGISYFYMGTYKEALKVMREVEEEFFEEMKASSQTTLLKNICCCYNRLGMYALSTEYALRALNICEESHEIKEIPHLFTVLGNINLEWENLEVAQTYYDSAYVYFQDREDLGNQAMTLNNLGAVYTKSGDYRAAHQSYQKALEIYLQENDWREQGRAVSNIANLHFLENKPDSSIYFYNKALELLEGMADSDLLASTFNNLGYVFLKTGKYNEAKEMIFKAYFMSRETGDLKEELIATKNLAALFKKQEDYKMALNYYELYKALDDSLFNHEKHALISDLNIKYDLAKKEKEIALLNKRQEIDDLIITKQKHQLIIIGFIVLILFGVIFLQFKLTRNRRKLIRLNMDLGRLRQRISQDQTIQKEEEKVIEREDLGNRTTQLKKDLFRRLLVLMEQDKVYRRKDLTVEKLSELLGTNKTYIYQTIKENTHCSFKSFINRYRIEEAREILADPHNDLPIKMISANLGFKSRSTFYKAFNEEAGVTPAMLRERALENVAKEEETLKE